MPSMIVPQNALVMIGDGRKALFLRNEGTPLHPKLKVEEVLQQDNPPTRAQGSDRPGRLPGTDGNSRSAVQETDWHQLEEDRFAISIAAALYRAAHSHTFEQMVVVAPPKILGDLRKAFHSEVRERVVAEIPKDLTSHPLPDIARLLS